MLNEDKIKLMTSISMFEKKEEKHMLPVKRYFMGDYISRNLLRAFIGYTFCWILAGILLVIYRAEDIFSMISLDLVRSRAFWYLGIYLAGLAVYLIITGVVYARRYHYGVRVLKVYVAKLKRLEKRYEFQSRTKELGREVKRHDRTLGI